MNDQRDRKCLYVSIAFHVVILLVLVLGFDTTSNMFVFQNTDKNDVISAVVLGDTAKSKILPQKITPQPVQEVKEQPKPQPETKPQTASAPPIKKDVIALKPDKKQLAKEREKALAEKMRKELMPKDLLADLKKQTHEKKKLQQKQLQSKYQKMLQEQAEKSLRQQLLDESIKLQGTETREAQGIVDKYKALIIQSISNHWVIPSQANKSLYCELMIRLAPGGMVLDVQVTKTSGDPSLDSSARAAVLKASPLPVPPDSGAFEPFRQFVLKVKPENILAADGGLGAG